jgi:outer membrane protein assembly complex protein YaeT
MMQFRPSRSAVLYVVVSAAVIFFGISRADGVGGASAYKGWSVSSVAIRGLDDKTASEIKNGLALSLSSGLLGTKKAVFFPQTLDDDVRRVQLYLARRGYPYATAKVRFEPNAKKRALGVTLDVRRGPAVRVASVTLDGFPSDLAADAAKTVSFGPDSVFVDGDVEKTTRELALGLQKQGYARATVEPGIEWRDSTSVEVFYRCVPGALFYFGDIVVTRAPEDIAPLVKRVITADRGARYDPAVLDDSQKNLRILGLFRQIRLDLQESAPDTLDVIAEVSMRESQRIETAVRYWTDQNLDVAFRWTHRNLFGGGRGASAGMSASTLLQRIEFSAWWPAVVHPRSRLTGTAGVRRENEESYEQTDVGVDATLSYEWSLQTTTRWGVIVSNVDVTEKTPSSEAIIEQDGLLTALTFSWERDRTDNPIVATRGNYLRIDLEWAPPAEITEYHYFRIEPTAQVYMGFLRVRNTVLAARLTGGVAEPRGSSASLLPSKRFYAGGASSMRGFQRRKLGPLDEDGAPLGGDAKVEGSVELRFPVYRRLRGAGFVDAGQVWATTEEVRTDNIEVALGTGLWLDTIIGPIRGDVAYRLTDYEKTQPRWAYHLSIGPAF